MLKQQFYSNKNGVEFWRLLARLLARLSQTVQWKGIPIDQWNAQVTVLLQKKNLDEISKFHMKGFPDSLPDFPRLLVQTVLWKKGFPLTNEMLKKQFYSKIFAEISKFHMKFHSNFSTTKLHVYKHLS